MKICGIYKITSPNDRVYVGQAVHLVRRLLSYFEPNGNPFQIRLQASFQKYGIEQHSFIVLEECAEEKLNERERYWQEQYNVLSKKGLNCKLTSLVGKSGKLSDETKKKIGDSTRGTTKTCKHTMKVIQQFDKKENLINEFASAREASRQLSLDCGSISKCCNGKQYKSVGGFVFKYKENE